MNPRRVDRRRDLEARYRASASSRSHGDVALDTAPTTQRRGAALRVVAPTTREYGSPAAAPSPAELEATLRPRPRRAFHLVTSLFRHGLRARRGQDGGVLLTLSGRTAPERQARAPISGRPAMERTACCAGISGEARRLDLRPALVIVDLASTRERLRQTPGRVRSRAPLPDAAGTGRDQALRVHRSMTARATPPHRAQASCMRFSRRAVRRRRADRAAPKSKPSTPASSTSRHLPRRRCGASVAALPGRDEQRHSRRANLGWKLAAVAKGDSVRTARQLQSGARASRQGVVQLAVQHGPGDDADLAPAGLAGAGRLSPDAARAQAPGLCGADEIQAQALLPEGSCCRRWQARDCRQDAAAAAGRDGRT